MTAQPGSPTQSAEKEIVISRVINAPRELVWEAFTDPAQMVKWWGPDGFVIPIHESDVRVGGMRRYTMRGPDGKDYPNKSILTEIVRPERLSFRHGWDTAGERWEMFQATWTFEDQGGRTKVTGRMVFPSAEERNKVVKEFGAIEGGKQTLGRLAAYLEPGELH